MSRRAALLLSTIFLLLPACATSPTTPNRFNYETSVTCEQGPNLGKVSRKPLSALTGFQVGPKAALHFKNLDQPILRPFTSDGCSASPDGSFKEPGVWTECCVHHDLSYWLGGSTEEKKAADAKLEACLDHKGYPAVGKVYRSVVERFGGGNSTQTYRWGYGWNYKRPMTPLTSEEEKQIDILYGIRRDQVDETLFPHANPLLRMCDTFDPVFHRFSAEERMAYSALNETLSSDDVIAWAQWGPSDFSRRTLKVKLRHCSADVEVIFDTKAKSKPVIHADCGAK